MARLIISVEEWCVVFVSCPRKKRTKISRFPFRILKGVSDPIQKVTLVKRTFLVILVRGGGGGVYRFCCSPTKYFVRFVQVPFFISDTPTPPFRSLT